MPCLWINQFYKYGFSQVWNLEWLNGAFKDQNIWFGNWNNQEKSRNWYARRATLPKEYKRIKIWSTFTYVKNILIANRKNGIEYEKSLGKV